MASDDVKGYHIVEDGAYLRIRHDGNQVIAIIPKAFRVEADIMLKALTDSRDFGPAPESTEQIIAKALEGVEPYPLPFSDFIRDTMKEPGITGRKP